MNKLTLVGSIALSLLATQTLGQPGQAGGGGNRPAASAPGGSMSSMGDMHSDQMSSGPMMEQGRAMSEQMRNATPEERAAMGRAMEGSSDAMMGRRVDAMMEREAAMDEMHDQMMDREHADMPADAMMGRPEALPEQASDRAVEMQDRSEERQEIMEEARAEDTEPGRKPWWKFWGD